MTRRSSSSALVRASLALLVAAGAAGAGSAAELPDPFPARPVQQAAIASDGTRLVLFFRSHLEDPILFGKDDPGLLTEWSGSSWSAAESITNECHEPDVAVSGNQVAMLWTDDSVRPNAACEPSCRPARLLSYDSALRPRMTFVGASPVASFTQVVGGNDRLFVERMDNPPLPGGPPELLGGNQCFDDPYFHCPSLESPALAADGASWIAAYVALPLDGPCVGVRRGTAVPDTCLGVYAGDSLHAVEIAMVRGEPFVLWAETHSSGRGSTDFATAARFDPVSGWVLAEDVLGFTAGSGLSWQRIRAVSDGAEVTALYEQSDGRLVARAWNGTWRSLGVLAEAGASSSDLALRQGVAYASFVLDGRAHVESLPEPEPAGLAIASCAVLLAARAGLRVGQRGRFLPTS